MTPAMMVQTGPRSGDRIELTGHEVYIGRDGGCRVVLDDALVSGQHAMLRLADGGWMIHDLKISNGTIVNGAPVTTVPLRHVDRVAIGQTEMVFVTEPGEWKTSPAAGMVAPAASAEDIELVSDMQVRTEAIRREVAPVIVGQRDVVDQRLMVLLAGGHGLIVGLPGMAKTLMVRTIAAVLDMDFKRIQFTPDLMPTDITGTEVLETNRDTGQREFRFIPGPIFCHLLLAVELNRSPRTALHAFIFCVET